ncbi:hypothetical protein BCCH1_78040 (plasmid) [Burkholderia contaminans]|uniref:Uncharacterized protein n=3 Tax=Burkholderia cepacia complex TaxID=87882 RepID=A0A250LL96_9BURK|nr:hypothetical protein BCCH1_78040 [Burkholderia contaminans]
MPMVLKRFGDPSDPTLGFPDGRIRAELRSLGVVLRAADFNRLALALRRTPIVPGAELLDQVRSQLGGRKPTKEQLRKVVAELGLSLNYRQMIGLYQHVVDRQTTAITDDVLANLRAKSGGRPLTRESIGELATSLGYKFMQKDIAQITRLLRLDASQEPVVMNRPTLELAKMLAKKTGVPIETVFHRALVDSAFGMLDHRRFQFDPRGRDPLSIQQVRLRVQVIDPQSFPRETDLSS